MSSHITALFLRILSCLLSFYETGDSFVRLFCHGFKNANVILVTSAPCWILGSMANLQSAKFLNSPDAKRQREDVCLLQKGAKSKSQTSLNRREGGRLKSRRDAV